MLTEASMHLLSWISKNRKKTWWEKGKLLPQFLRNNDTWGIWKCGHESWMTREEWTAGDVLIHSQTIGLDVKDDTLAAAATEPERLRLICLVPQLYPHHHEKFKTNIKHKIVSDTVCYCTLNVLPASFPWFILLNKPKYTQKCNFASDIKN